MSWCKNFLILFIASSTHSIVPESIFQNEYLEVEEIVEKDIINLDNIRSNTVEASALVKKVLADVDNRVPKTFHIPPYFYDNVEFWFRIYTQYSSKNVVLHDKEDLGIIYSVLNFNDLYANKKYSRYKKDIRKDALIKRETRKIKKALLELSRTRSPKTPYAVKIQKMLISKQFKAGTGRKRAQSFKRLINNLRAQTGQRDKIFQGLLNITPYQDFIYEHMDYFELPRELLAVPFLESSFNPRARSRVGASGIWQFMPNIGKAFMPMDKITDSRDNPLLSSLGAFHLLKQNFQILKRWDLSVTAYNSGTKHLLRARRKLKMSAPSLETIFTKYKHPHLGFASKNFYSEFLALVFTLDYKTSLFPLKGLEKGSITNAPKFRYNKINLYVSKCGLIPNRLFSALQRSSSHLGRINNHLKKPNQIYKRGTLIFSDIPLTAKRYYKLSKEQIRRKFPRNYKVYLKGHKCSTK